MGLTGAAMAWQLSVFRLSPALAETFPLSRHITIDTNCKWLKVLEVVCVQLGTVFKEPEHWFKQPEAFFCLLVHHNGKWKAI